MSGTGAIGSLPIGAEYTESERRYYEQRGVPAIVEELQTGSGRDRIHASRALILFLPEDKQALEALILVLQDKKGSVRQNAAFSLVASKNPIIKDPLVKALCKGKGDKHVAYGALNYFIALGIPETEKYLIHALLRADTYMASVALAFRNSGNPSFERAAEKWAARVSFGQSRKVWFEKAVVSGDFVKWGSQRI
jgi:HEAT repeat protein